MLRHRIVTNFNAEAEGIKSDTIVRKLIDYIPRGSPRRLDRRPKSAIPRRRKRIFSAVAVVAVVNQLSPIIAIP